MNIEERRRKDRRRRIVRVSEERRRGEGRRKADEYHRRIRIIRECLFVLCESRLCCHSRHIKLTPRA
jgi:hypothetical protein